MARTISVDQQVYETIARLQAKSGERTVNDAMRLLLDLPATQRRSRPRTTDAVMTALRGHPNTTAIEVAKAAGLAYSTTTSILAELKKSGLAESAPDQTDRRPGGITYRWRLSTPAPAPTPAPQAIELHQLVSRLHGNAADEAAEARAGLIEQLNENRPGELDLTGAMYSVAYRQSYARWWAIVIRHINQHGLNPITALNKARDAAHRTLLRIDARTPCVSCPHTKDPVLIRRQATADFHRSTETSALQTAYGIALPADAPQPDDTPGLDPTATTTLHQPVTSEKETEGS